MKECCGLPTVQAIYLPSRTMRTTPITVCAQFVADHPTEFRVISATQEARS